MDAGRRMMNSDLHGLRGGGCTIPLGDSDRPVTIEAGELARLRAIEAAARRLLTLDVADPVARAIALAVIASGLREALGLA